MNVEFLKDVALAVAQEQHLETVMKMIVEGVSQEPDAALVRLWFLAPGDICAECYLRPECPDQTRCLHLVASAGHSLDQHENWTRDRKSTRLNSSHANISYAVFCLKNHKTDHSAL